MSDDLSDFSICIPTFNRADLLKQCLNYLSSFRGQNFELIVGDNHSTDNTQVIATSFQPRFRHFTYFRHPTNIGFCRNMDAILRRATRPYVYILSDDDFVFEGALALVKKLMASQPQVVAVAGKYLSVTQLLESTEIDYSDGVVGLISKNDHRTLLDNYIVCDGHPFVRREIFQRHCAYWDRTVGLFPLFMRLVSFGDVLVVNKPFFQHLTNGESLTGSLTETWMLDMANADFELALSMPSVSELRDRLNLTRQKFLQLIYLQAARMAFNKTQFYLLWLFLKRLHAVQGSTEDLMVHAESAFMRDILISRLSQLVADGCFSEITYQDTPLCAAAVCALKQIHPKLSFLPRKGTTNSPGNLGLMEEYDSTVTQEGPSIALHDLFSQLRLTHFRGQLVASGHSITVRYDDPKAMALLNQRSKGFDMLCMQYASNALCGPNRL